MRRGVILLLLVVAISLLGCQHVPKPATSTSTLNLGGEGVVAEIWVSDACPENGEIVTARATVTNKGAKTQVIDSKDRPVLDLGVGVVGGAYTHWSDGKALTPDLTRLELQPGQSKTIQIDLTVSDNSASYGAGATFNYDAKGFPLLPGVSFAGPHASTLALP